jgi:hypothetical protein
MIGFVKDNFIYIKCPKNGCMTFSELLTRHNWVPINLFENNLDYSKYIIWGHITEPTMRHTKGLVQYLKVNPELDINDTKMAKLLVSGVFDEHTYSLSMMLGPLFHLPIQWIPLDAEIKNYKHPDSRKGFQVIYNGDDLTNDFFKQHNIDIKVTLADRLNVSTPLDNINKKRIDDYKTLYDENFQKIVKNFLEPDIIVYNKTLKEFRIKYGPNT